LVSEQQKPGYYSIIWNGRDNQNRTCSQGIYFIQMQTDSYRSQKKVVLAR
jgi:flagellar hook assembly protein FlgD